MLVGLVTPPNTLRAIERDAIAVKISEAMSTEGARGFYPNDWPGGAVRPLLSWDFEYLPQTSEENAPQAQGHEPSTMKV
jgi:hypothetical protein